MVGWLHQRDGHEFEQAPGVGNGQGSLVCCNPWGHKESDTTENNNNLTQTRGSGNTFQVKYVLVATKEDKGEGKGTPLQYSCLEKPMDGGAWQAAVHGVTKSQTRLSDFTFNFTFMPWRRKWQPTPVESQGRGSLVGYRLWGRTESDTTEATQQQQQHLFIKILTKKFCLNHFIFPYSLLFITECTFF